MEIMVTKEKFIELRAKGWSFDKIAKELGKAKQTLIDWSKELKEEISYIKALELEALYESYYIQKETRLKNLSIILSKLKEEVENRDLSDIPTDKLLDIYLKYNNYIKEEIIEPTYKSSTELNEIKEDKELLDRLTTPEPYKKLKIG